MRAARLLRILLLLQNRGRQTSAQLANELEVTPRTILRDVDAMTEAGLPIIVHQGNRGGIELGFDYRTRLTGLSREEAQALGLILAAQNPVIGALGLEAEARQAGVKLIESLPDKTRKQIAEISAQFSFENEEREEDGRVPALARAVQARAEARLRFGSCTEQLIHPIGMKMTRDTWSVHDALGGEWIELNDWGRVNISGLSFSVHIG